MIRNPVARHLVQEATNRVKTGVRSSAESFVEQEVAPLRARIEELEERVKELERQLARLSQDGK